MRLVQTPDQFGIFPDVCQYHSKQSLRKRLRDHHHIRKQADRLDNSLVAVQKPGKLRVCKDPRDLNRGNKRPQYQMPIVDEVLPKLAKTKVFAVLDAKDGFY